MGCMRPPGTDWIVVHYPMDDDELYANGGHGFFFIGCTVCEEVEIVRFILPPDEDVDAWAALAQHGDPEVLGKRTAFQFTHAHGRI